MEIPLGKCKDVTVTLACVFCKKIVNLHVVKPDGAGERYVVLMGWHKIENWLWCGSCDPRKKEEK